MDVTPYPWIAILEQCDHRKGGHVEMLKRMNVLRVFTTAHVAAGQTDAKLGPRRTDRDAFLAAVGARRDVANFREMFALLRHRQVIVDDASASTARVQYKHRMAQSHLPRSTIEATRLNDEFHPCHRATSAGRSGIGERLAAFDGDTNAVDNRRCRHVGGSGCASGRANGVWRRPRRCVAALYADDGVLRPVQHRDGSIIG